MITFRSFLQETTSTASAAEIAAIIKRDCQPFLAKSGKQLAWRGINPYSSFLKNLNDSGTFKLGTVRKDRQPRDSAKELHDLLNNYFVSKVGLPLRSNSLFVTGSETTAFIFASHNREKGVYAVFPIGKFTYAWSRLIDDPTYEFQERWLEGVSGGEPRKFYAALEETWKKFTVEEKIYDTYKTPEDFVNSLSSPSELLDYFTLFTAKNKLWPRFIKYFLAKNDPWTFNSGLKEALSRKYQEHEIMIACDRYYLVHASLAKEVASLL